METHRLIVETTRDKETLVTTEVHIENTTQLRRQLQRLREGEPRMFQLVALNGDDLIVAGSKDVGMLHYRHCSLEPPYWMSFNPDSGEGIRTFRFINGEETEVDLRNCLPMEDVIEAACYFLETGELSPTVNWKEA